MSITPSTLGKTIAQIRHARGLTQQVVADRVGVTVTFISMIENGLRNVRIETLNKMADVFGIPANWIVFLSGNEQQTPEFGQNVAALGAATRKAIWSFFENRLQGFDLTRRRSF